MLCEYGVENLHSPAFKLDVSTNFTQTGKAVSLQLCGCKFHFITQERGNLSLPWRNPNLFVFCEGGERQEIVCHQIQLETFSSLVERNPKRKAVKTELLLLCLMAKHNVL